MCPSSGQLDAADGNGCATSIIVDIAEESHRFYNNWWSHHYQSIISINELKKRHHITIITHNNSVTINKSLFDYLIKSHHWKNGRSIVDPQMNRSTPESRFDFCTRFCWYYHLALQMYENAMKRIKKTKKLFCFPMCFRTSLQRHFDLASGTHLQISVQICHPVDARNTISGDQMFRLHLIRVG